MQLDVHHQQAVTSMTMNLNDFKSSRDNIFHMTKRLISSVDELIYKADDWLGKSQAGQMGDCTAGEQS